MRLNAAQILIGFMAFAMPASAVDIAALPIVFPALPSKATDVSGFVPKGWRIDVQKSGDLNNDGKADLVFVLIGDDLTKIIPGDANAQDYANTNPRMFGIAFANKSNTGFVLALQNHTLIPQTVERVFDDPLSKDDLVIKNNTVTFAFYAFFGSIVQPALQFRFQHNKLELIGFENYNTDRSSGTTTATSINYLTHKMIITTGNIGTDATTSKTKMLKEKPLLELGEIGNGLEFEG